ncbi:MAG: DUF885 domain-containing protein [Robiginitomaculum sp.]|nr:MAG: DUF885 domain-containing protein [Robiginitomaculum sp.]
MRIFYQLLLSSTVITTLAFTACAPAEQTPQQTPQQTSQHSPPQTPLGTPTTAHIQSESQQLNDWFAARYQDSLARSPLTQTYLGIKDAQDKLDDVSQAAIDEGYALEQNWLKDMKSTFNFNQLDAQAKISYRLFEYDTRESADAHPFKQHGYVFTHMSGEHTGFPTFMMNFHTVNSPTDAKAYIARLKQANRYLGQLQTRAEAQYTNGIRLPKFVYPKLVTASQNVISGAPFDNGPDSPMFADIKTKISAIKDISDGEKSTLIDQAEAALLSSVKPAYENLISMFEAQETGATTYDGAWKLPDGKDYYNSRLLHYTTTVLSADYIHEIGLKEVSRIQSEMRRIMARVGFQGSLQDFYTFLRTDPQFTYANDDAGREQYMTEATAIINTMKSRLDDLFITKPKADMVVKRVEPFREDTAFGAFYNQPAMDGSRPGTYFINLKDVRQQPTYLMQALAYHEGIPGHHMQIAIALELDGIPEFRKQGGHTAYVEGWGLYAESVPAELGMYTDPYSDFGRLSMEIFRAARLVVDTGIHAQKWTREQAVQYMLENIANPEGDIRAEVDRYIVWPGQATAYKIGMLKIQELKKRSQSQLGDKFDIREFHDVILANGSVPLSILEYLVDEYITKNQ